ncbi:MAG TPA: hypothetical protein VK966_07140 [Longimicrobiales bacterium]|nr:hypothetical protein [Longimicrobiales bacterium]
MQFGAGAVMRPAVLGLALVLALGGPGAPAAAQEASGLSFVGGVAYERGGPGDALVRSLREAGLDDVRTQSCPAPNAQCEDVAHPFHFSEGIPIAGFIGARYRFTLPVSVEALVSNGERGHAEGYNEERSEHLIVGHTSFLLTTTAGAHLGPVRIALGPTLKATRWKVTRNSGAANRQSTMSVGATAELSAALFTRAAETRFRAGYRAFPDRDLSGTLHEPLEAEYRSFYVGVTVSPPLD